MRHQLLEHDLVHAQRRGQHAGADVGHVEALEQALDGPVLAERTVEHREHDVAPVKPAPGRQRHSAAVDRATPRRAPISITATSWPAVSQALARPTRPRPARPRARRSGRRRAPRRAARSRLVPGRVVGSLGGRRRRVVVVVGGGRRLGSAVKWPTTIVTVLPCWRVRAAGRGSARSRSRPWLWLVTSLVSARDLEARPPGAALGGAPAVSPVTCGHRRRGRRLGDHEVDGRARRHARSPAPGSG